MGALITNSYRFKMLSFAWFTLITSIISIMPFLLVSLNTHIDLFYFFYGKNILGLSLLYTGIICGVLVFLLSDVRVFLLKAANVVLLFGFTLCVWFFINESSPLNLFFIYELFLLPSFYLVYRLSPNRRSIIAAIYFLTWTQFGSLLVLIGIVISFYNNGSLSFTACQNQNSALIFWLFFLGFGIKIPMWPFYYWLTKTHVEASSFFSMYLSGFLVKTAVFLFIKFYCFYGLYHYTLFFLTLLIVGIFDSSIKMWHQTDLKKLIAYTTVQEMNFLCIPILWNDLFGETIVALFIATHCLLSCIFFFFIDVITKRFNTRVTSQISGLSGLMPTFSLIIFISWVLFSGLPFTIKFLLEVSVFSLLMNYNALLSLALLIVMNIIGIVGFSKNTFNALFGSPVIVDFIVYDLTKKETLLYVFFITNLILLNALTILMW